MSIQFTKGKKIKQQQKQVLSYVSVAIYQTLKLQQTS